MEQAPQPPRPAYQAPAGNGRLRAANDFLDWLGGMPVLIALLVFPLVKPYLNVMLSRVWFMRSWKSAWELTVFLLCTPVLIAYIIRWAGGKIRRANPALLCVAGLYAWLYAVTKFRGGALVHLNDLHAAFALTLLLDMGIQRRRKATLLGFSLALEAWVYLNIIAILARPNGLWFFDFFDYHYWVLGNRVMYMRVLLPAVCFALMRWRASDRARQAHIALLLAASAYTVLRQGGGAAVGMALGLCALLLLFNRRALPRWLRPEYALGLSLLLTATLAAADAAGAPGFFIDRLMNKSASLSMRVQTWRAALTLIKAHPLAGMGVFPLETMQPLLAGQTHAHNQLLDLWVQGGAVAAAAYVACVVFAARALHRFRFSPAVKALALTLMLILLLGAIETMVRFTLFYPLLILASNADALAGRQKPLPECSLGERARRDWARRGARG